MHVFHMLYQKRIKCGFIMTYCCFIMTYNKLDETLFVSSKSMSTGDGYTNPLNWLNHERLSIKIEKR